MILSTLRRSFQSYPLLANVVTTTTLFATADATCQILEQKEVNTFNVRRLGNIMTMGLLYYGPLYFYYYRLLDRKLPGKGPRTVLTKLFIDQFIFTAPCLCGFFLCMGVLEGRSWENNVEELKLEYIPTYMTSCVFWPTAQSINFAFVPPMYRIAYISSMTLVWMTFMSFIKNQPVLPAFLVKIGQASDDIQDRMSKSTNQN